MAERDVGDWLYARFLKDKAGTDTRFAAEIVDISRGGMRVRLVDNGAIAFIPAPFLHAVRDELVCSQENGTVQIKGETVEVPLPETSSEISKGVPDRHMIGNGAEPTRKNTMLTDHRANTPARLAHSTQAGAFFWACRSGGAAVPRPGGSRPAKAPR